MTGNRTRRPSAAAGSMGSLTVSARRGDGGYFHAWPATVQLGACAPVRGDRCLRRGATALLGPGPRAASRSVYSCTAPWHLAAQRGHGRLADFSERRHLPGGRTPAKAPPLKEGAEVEARFGGETSGSPDNKAVNADGSYDIDYADGDSETCHCGVRAYQTTTEDA